MISKQALELDSQVLVLEKVSRTLAQAHERGIAHGNLKPTNILLDENGNPHLTDFGLAAIEGVSQPGEVISDAEYRAPEQGDGTAKPYGDIYAIGVLLFKALTSRTPHELASESGVGLPRVPSAINPAAPADLEAICLRCLRPDPNDRYPTMTAVAEDLHRWLKGEPVLARQENTVSRQAPSNRRALVLALVAAVLAVGVLVVKACGSPSEKTGSHSNPGAGRTSF